MPAAVTGAGPAPPAKARSGPADPGRLPGPEPRARPDRPEPARPRVRTNQINVRIDAVPGAGNLLGNLLCAVTEPAQPDGCARPADRCAQQPRRRAERAPGARPDEPRDRRRRSRRTLVPTRPQGALAVPCGRRGHLLRHPAHGHQAPGQLHRRRSCSTSPARTAATRRSTASSTCTRSRSTYDPAELRERDVRPAGDAGRPGPGPRALDPLPPERRARSTPSWPGCSRA